jgi:hypothetical protein
MSMAPNDNHEAGAARVFTRSGGVKSQRAKLVAAGALARSSQQGWSVSLHLDKGIRAVGPT